MAKVIGPMLVVLLLWPAGRAAAQPACAGDCDGGGAVTIDELILGVDLGLGVGQGTCDGLDGNGDGAMPTCWSS